MTDLRNDWRPVGAVARQLIRRLGLPLPTALVVLESAGVPVEGRPMKTLSFSSALMDVIAGCQNDLEVIKERRAAMKARLDNAAAIHGIDPAAVRRLLAWLRTAEKNEINRDRKDEIDAIYKVIANGGVPVLPSRSDIELDRVMELTNTDKPPKIAAIRQAIGCSQGKAQKLRKSAAARLAAKSSSSRGIDEHELLTEQDRPSDGPRVGEQQKRQIEPFERTAAKKATLPHEPETGEIVEPHKGADDDGLEIPNFLKRPLPARMVTP